MTTEHSKHAHKEHVLQLNQKNETPRCYLPARRIPRGNSGRSDSLTVIARNATANGRRIKGMMGRVKHRSHRDELKELRLRLVEILGLIAKAPERLQIGTFEEIDDLMQEARDLYGRVPKLDGRRRKNRSAERNGVRGENRREMRYSGAEEGDECIITTPSIRPADARATAFAAELDANERSILAAGHGGAYDMSEEGLVNK